MRKRNTLDTSEANFVYTRILLMINRDERMKNLPIPVKNKLIDSAGLQAIRKANKNPEDVEAIYFEYTSYKLSDEEREKSLRENLYEKINKPQGYTDFLRDKYSGIIEKSLEEEFEKLDLNF